LAKLSVQARSRQELEQALRSRRVPSEAAQRVLDRLQQAGLVDDEKLARNWVESRQARRHLSRSALRHELQVKGVGRDEIDAALDEVSRDDELRAARSLAGKRLESMAGVSHQAKQRRVAGVLARRGFSSDVIARVLADVLGGPE
jgi:regulatory protein